MIRSHAELLLLIVEYGHSGGDVGLLGEVDKSLFDLYDTLERVKVLAAIGALDGCRGCDEALAIIKGELGTEPK